MSAIAEPVKDIFVQQQILDAAKKLFQAYGLQKVTMDDVAKAIGKGRSSLYYYYKSKDEVFNAVMEVEIGEMLSVMTSEVAKANTIEEKLTAFCISKLVFLKEKHSFFKTLDAGMDADALSQFNRLKLSHHQLIIKQEGALMQQIILDAVENGEIRSVSKNELPNLVFVLLTGLRGMKREMEMESNFESAEPLVNTFTRVMINGLK